MVAHVMGSLEPVVGRDALGAALDTMLRAFPDMHVHNDPYRIQFGAGDWTTVIGRITGTFSGEMVLPDGTVTPGMGKSFEVDMVLEVEGARGSRGVRVRTGSDRAGVVFLPCRWGDSCWPGGCGQGAEPLPAGQEGFLPRPVRADFQDPLPAWCARRAGMCQAR
jgi:hypothetical protein